MFILAHLTVCVFHIVLYYKSMWQLWTMGILGMWTALVPFLGFTPDLKDIITVASGIAVAVFAFWAAGVKKPA